MIGGIVTPSQLRPAIETSWDQARHCSQSRYGFRSRVQILEPLLFGAGIDTRTVVHVLTIPIGFRIEVRDFYSGLPNYNQKVTANLQN